MMKLPRRAVAALVTVVVVVPLAAFTLARRGPEVTLATLETDVAVRVYGLGTVEARVLSKVGFTVAGRLVELQADAGDLVPKGAVLARLDDAEQRARLAQALAVADKARAQASNARVGIAKAEATKLQKERTSDRRVSLTRSGTVSEEVAGDALTAAKVAAADLRAAHGETSLAEATLADAMAQVELNRVLLERHTLTAPYDARVAFRHREAGSVLASGEAMFTLFDPSRIWVLAHVDEAASGAVAVGQTAEVRLRSLPGRSFAGTVQRIDIESDRTAEERRVYVACAECPPNLGEQAEVFIDLARLPKALLVHEDAVSGLDAGQGRVWTVEGGRLALRAVRFGLRTLDGRLQIAGDLPEGARVVARLPAGAREGDRVSVRE